MHGEEVNVENMEKRMSRIRDRWKDIRMNEDNVRRTHEGERQRNLLSPEITTNQDIDR